MLNVLTYIDLCFKFAWLIYILVVCCWLLLEKVELLVCCVLTCVIYFTFDNNQQLRTFDILLIYSDLDLCVVFVWLVVVYTCFAWPTDILLVCVWLLSSFLVWFILIYFLRTDASLGFLLYWQNAVSLWHLIDTCVVLTLVCLVCFCLACDIQLL